MPQSGSQFSPELFAVAASRPWGTQTSMNLQEQWERLAPLRIRTGCRAWGLTALVTHTLYLLTLTFSPLFEFPSGPGLGTVGPLVFGLRQAGLHLSHVASGGASLVAKALSPCPAAPWHTGSAAGPQTSCLRLPSPLGATLVGSGSRAERTAALQVGSQVIPAPSLTFTPSSFSRNKSSGCLIRMTQESPNGPWAPSHPPYKLSPLQAILCVVME